MAPAEMAGAYAEIVLLAVALSEQVLAQQSDLAEAVAPEVHTEPVCGRHIHDAARIRPAREAIQADGAGFVWNGVGSVRARIGEYRRIVGKWR